MGDESFFDITPLRSPTKPQQTAWPNLANAFAHTQQLQQPQVNGIPAPVLNGEVNFDLPTSNNAGSLSGGGAYSSGFMPNPAGPRQR